MRYPNEIIEEVRMQNDIVDVIGQYVPLKQKGSSYFGLCPFHNEKSPSFSVNSEKQIYYCFGCGAAGNVFGFLMEMENLDFPEALKTLAERANITLPEAQKSGQALAAQKHKDRLFALHGIAGRFYHDILQSEEGSQARAYLQDRQLAPNVVRKFGLGFAPERRGALQTHLKEQGFTLEEMVASGLVLKNKDNEGYHDRFRGRILFPIFDVQGRVVGFGGRILGRGEPKYLNSPETILFSKSRNLYGLNFAKQARKKELILVEGYMDMISLYQAGFHNVVAALGTAFNDEHARALKKYAEEVLLLYDSDEAGTNAALRAIPVLVRNGLRVRVTQVTGGKDPDDFIKEQGAVAFSKLLMNAVHYISFEIACIQKKYNLENPEHRVRFATEAAEILSKPENEIERNVYAGEVSRMTGIEEEALRNEIQKRTKRLEEKAQKDFPIKRNFKQSQVSYTQEKGLFEAQRSLLYYSSTDQNAYEALKGVLEEHDFIQEIYHRVFVCIGGLWQANGNVFPAELLSQFQESAEQKIVTEIFSIQIPPQTKEDLEKAVNEGVKKLKARNIDGMMATATTVEEIQKLVEAKRNLDSLYITI